MRGPVTTTTPAGVRVHSLHLHEGALREHVHALKYEEQTRWAARLGGALGRLMQAELRASVLVPLPLHPARLAERGYNQAALLARGVARRTSARVSFDLLERRKETQKQAALGRAERARNALDAFAARPHQVAAFLAASLWLVDDVVTTGATLDAAARALEEVGLSVSGAVTVALAEHEVHANATASDAEFNARDRATKTR